MSRAGAATRSTPNLPARNSFMRFDGRMAQPSKGDRVQMASRIPRPAADRVRHEAAARGQSLSEYIAAVLCREVGLPDLAPPENPAKAEDLPRQEEWELTG